MNPLLRAEPKYFPIEKPLYEVGPGLKLFGADQGAGDYDQKIFQITDKFNDFRANKLICRQEKFDKYITEQNLDPIVAKKVTQFIANRLVLDYPGTFTLKDHKLICSHTDDEIIFDNNWGLLSFKSEENMNTPVQNSLDALLLQVPEDISILKRKPDGDDYLTYLNLCSPSHWAAQDKIGKNFYNVHVPVASSEKLLKASSQFVDSMIKRGPFVRFVWSFVTDLRLNHHPDAPPGWDFNLWKGRSFASEKTNPFYFRVERQTVWGFPEIEASLFTIRVSFLTGESIKNNPHQSQMLVGALKSMTPESRIYKGVAPCFEELINYLQSATNE